MSEAYSPARKKPRRYTSIPEEKTRCACGNILCDEAMRKLLELHPTKYSYFTIPREVRDTKWKPSIQQKLHREIRSKRRERFLAALGGNAAERASDKSFSKNTEIIFASLHVHDDILQFCTEHGRIRKFKKLPKFIPREVGLKLTREGLCIFTETDIYPGTRNYFPLPNYPVAHFCADVDMLESKQMHDSLSTFEPIQIPAVTRGGTAITSSPTFYRNEMVESTKMKIAQREKLLKSREDNLVQRERELELRGKQQRKMLEEKEKSILEREKQLLSKMEDVQSLCEQGVSRFTLVSKEWHKENPNAATTLFGFSSWKETVLYIHALFNLYPPTTKTKPSDPISQFEWCLMGKLRMHCAMSNRFLACILGLKSFTYVGLHVKKWVMEWGSAGSDLSILDITPEFLKMTCPQAYKDCGLELTCGLPDGKDFKIYTPRNNTLLTRACHSNKVEASAVRCISWSTPMGLSYEHSDLFLGRVSEKRLVELWAPRLKKCPLGWYMLSDRGFADTARFYPNMNQQKTPKFLRGRKQFSAEEVSADRTICKLRYTCEVAFARVTKTKGLRDVISADFFPLLDAMNNWGHAAININAPLLPFE